MNTVPLSDVRLSEIRTLITSTAEADKEKLPGAAQELYDEVTALRLKVAAHEQHIQAQNALIAGAA